MRYYSILIAAVVLTAFSAICAEEAREIIYSDDFSGYTKDSDLASKWSLFSGKWSVKDGALRQDAEGYDHGLVVNNLYLRCDYSVEVRTRKEFLDLADSGCMFHEPAWVKKNRNKEGEREKMHALIGAD